MPATKKRKKGCEFRECFHELRIARDEWIALRSHAFKLDLNDGSHYDARIGAINFWCGPENKPASWPGKIPKGYLKYPRDYVGCVMTDGFTEDAVTLHFEVVAYARADVSGETRFSSEYRRRLRGTKADRDWILKQFQLLRQHVRLMQGD